MFERSQVGAGVLIIVALILSMIFVTVAFALQFGKTKEVERALSVEYNLKTYYVAYAGLNECIALRMAPRSNVLINRKDLTTSTKKKFDRISNSGYIYSDPHNIKKDNIIGEYTYLSYLVRKDENGKYLIDDVGADSEQYLVYSKGTTTLPDGTKDVVYIKALFDLNRFDQDAFSVDEIEEFNVFPASDPEAEFVESLIKKALSDRLPPMVRTVEFNTLRGNTITVGVHDNNDNIKVENVGVRSKIDVQFSEPIDGKFLDGIQLSNVSLNQSVEDVEKIVLSPKNIDVVVLPPKQSNGQVLDYSSEYKLEISGVSDYNGNTIPEGPEITFVTEQKPSEMLEFPEATEGKITEAETMGSVGSDGSDTGPVRGGGERSIFGDAAHFAR